jgi:hypothetical protein
VFKVLEAFYGEEFSVLSFVFLEKKYKVKADYGRNSFYYGPRFRIFLIIFRGLLT